MKIQFLNDLFTSFFETMHHGVYSVFPNKNISYGLTIILLTLLIKLVLLPLNIKQIKSTLMMSAIAPEIKKLQTKYKNDPQKQQQETMKLYKEKGVSPFGGCLPMLIQWPILVALYYVFYNLSGINGVSFLWIKDLSKAAALSDPTSFILPIVSALTTYVAGILSMPKNADAAQVKQTTTMNLAMSLLLLYMSIKFKAALVLYWVVGNLFQIAQTRFTMYLMKSKTNEVMVDGTDK
ncbi:MAG: membrane protein insertase YidC [Bacillota bacterium]|nr:membrane protein insertase YidC [Bacillota bacterium]